MTAVDRADIAQLIPHQGAMSLLDRVASWNETIIIATSTTHRRMDHPLRHRERLRAVHLCEYGAQAAALHGGARLPGVAARDQLRVPAHR
jgi:predicted hotdog family 3-hydroxylacyl-ACP dehydratase